MAGKANPCGNRREAVVCFVDDAGLTLAIALVPWIVLIHIMF